MFHCRCLVLLFVWWIKPQYNWMKPQFNCLPAGIVVGLLQWNRFFFLAYWCVYLYRAYKSCCGFCQWFFHWSSKRLPFELYLSLPPEVKKTVVCKHVAVGGFGLDYFLHLSLTGFTGLTTLKTSQSHTRDTIQRNGYRPSSLVIPLGRALAGRHTPWLILLFTTKWPNYQHKLWRWLMTIHFCIW